MERRSQRYNKEDNVADKKITRETKNQHLYDESNMKIGYDDIVNLDTQTKIDLSSLSNYTINSREDYQKIKDYKDISKENIEVEKEETNTDQVKSYEKHYDINSILDEARKNRIKYDELEKKRKLKETNYATLADINQKEEYEKNNDKINEEELTDLINTITSHNLLNEIKEAESKNESNDDILSDLLATSVDENLEEGIAKQFTEESKVSKFDESFYTNSIDLSDQDFELSDELENDKKIKIKIIIIVIIVVILISIIAIGFLKQKGII